uniref:RNA helicase n=1 Tax=Micromonas pusilla TaxID=38833 RepID=A0A7S0GP72_MICPS|mmetsp:Transcript_11887/g.50960  ORF Transcript_11887/g.50960 Transcript_11887/m.50960 type:complete len:2194 (+) Transcript_11887:108-6689(+)
MPHGGGREEGRNEDAKGGAEAHARYKQYQYKENASLVLTSDRSERVTGEPSGAPETLWGRIEPGTFGDRAHVSRPAELDERMKKSKEKRKNAAGGMDQDDLDAYAAKRKRRGAERASVLDAEADGSYRPKTRETRAAYEALLGMIQAQFGDQPRDVLRGAAEEVLQVLKDDTSNDPKRKSDVEKLMGPTSDESFARMVAVGKLVTDFKPGGAGDDADDAAGDALDDDIGVAVEFEEEDEETDNEVDEVLEASDVEEEEEGGEEAETAGAGVGVAGAAGAGGAGAEAPDDAVPASEIDAYWLQRQIASAFGYTDAEASESSKTAEEVLAALGNERDDERACENQLVLMLDYDKFDLIKKLLKSRARVVWCTRLARAQNDEEKAVVMEQMAARPEAAKVLDAMRQTGERASARARQSAMEAKIREEARRLRGEVAADVADAAAGHEAAAAGRKMLELDALAFAQGSHFMSNKRCELPAGSYRSAKKGYEEVHIPALKPKAFTDAEKLRPIDELPSWAHPAFAGMKTLNRVQSQVYETAMLSPENMLLCAPTGAGKTNVAMLTILHEIGSHRRPDGSLNTNAFKIVYVAPMKALVAEMVGNLGARLKPYGVNVRELTGDVSLSRAQIDDTQVIVTTPEKWDIITRKSGDRTYTQLVRLLIIDEIHLLHDTRGPVLESIVARTVRQVEQTREMVRLVGLSATLPNFEDVASFLRVNPAKGLFVFDNSFRPCPLQQQFIGVTVKKPLQRFQLMNDICYEKVMENAGKSQTIIFVHSRKETAKTAKAMRDTALQNDQLAKFLREDSASREILVSEAEQCRSADLRDVLPYGFAIHHAGMSRADRTLVEELFADGHVQVLVSTATLAWGVNLPAHTVIIKGTQMYNPEKGGWDELSFQDVMQMMGRAGRPQFDTFGEGIIITQHSELQYYLSLLNQQLPIESQFVANLADALNAEVVLGTVTSAREAVSWLGYTYLYVRMLRNPNLYGVGVDALEEDPALEKRRADLVHTAAARLDKAGLCRYDRRSGALQATDLGKIASHYYISHGTVQAFNEHLKPSMGDIELCRLFSLAEEFKYISVREEEKLELAKLAERVPIPVKESIEEPTAKINILLQAYISGMKLEGFALMSDMVYVTQSAGRILRCIFEIVLKRGWAALADKALALCKMAARRTWGSQTPLRQFKGIPADILAKVERKDLAWERYYDLTSQEIGELIRFPKMGKAIHKFVHQFPRVELSAHVQPITRSTLKVDLTLTPDFQWDEKAHGYAQGFWIIVEDNDGEHILHHEFFLLRMVNAEEDHAVSFTVALLDPPPPQYFVKLVSDSWLGSETAIPVSFKHLLLPEKLPPPTELLDLQPLPVSALKEGGFDQLFPDFERFNPVQTQTFQCLYNTDDNALVAAPTGSGKTACAEFAILRMLRKQKESPETAQKCVYMAPSPEVARERERDWRARFGGALGVSVTSLTGETSVDLKLLAEGTIVIATAKQWDVLSRRWKQRKNVQAVTLFIADELHLIGGADGPTTEIATSRMRYVGSQLERGARVVGLCVSLANARDIGEWIGAPASAIFNFPPGARPVPLDIHIQGVDITNFDARMSAMARPTYGAVTRHAPDGAPAIVFVPTRKHAKLLSLDLLTFAAADGNPHRFLNCDPGDVAPHLERVKDPAAAHALGFGVALLHESMDVSERETVQRVFASGAASVLVATAPLAWGLSVNCRLVVIAGTQYFDAGGAGSADYPVTDLLSMCGRASRPLVDAHGTAVLLCHAPRKAYYKKFLYEPFPVESHLDHFLHDHLSAEIVTRVVENKQDAVDYLTWTFYYRRLNKNPNYYNLTGATHRHLSDALSELVETTLADLEASKCVAVEDDMDVSPLNLGMIGAYYSITYTTIELFAASLTAKTKLKGLLEIVAGATEFEKHAARPGEASALRHVLNHSPVTLESRRTTDPHVKTAALLQAHFGRMQLNGDLTNDLASILPDAARLLQAIVDVISSSGWLAPALAAMELSQMVTQGMWDKDSALLQLPHVDKECAARCAEAGVESVYDIVDMEDDKRAALLQMSDAQMSEVAVACNRYPNVEVRYSVAGAETIETGDTVELVVELEREMDDGDLGPVLAPRFPKKKEESWWLVVGDANKGTLAAIKRVTLGRKSKVRLEFAAPEEAGKAEYTLFFMCDSYLGCDQEYGIEFDVKEGDGGGDSDMEEDE